MAGNFKQLFSRVQNILKKSGPFEVCSIYTQSLSPTRIVNRRACMRVDGFIMHSFKVVIYQCCSTVITLVVCVVQMLLCVGSFFNGSEQCRVQWQNYVEGKERGTVRVRCTQ